MAVMKMKAMKALKVTKAQMLKMQATIKEQGKAIKELQKAAKISAEAGVEAYKHIQMIMKKVNALSSGVLRGDQFLPSASQRARQLPVFGSF